MDTIIHVNVDGDSAKTHISISLTPTETPTNPSQIDTLTVLPDNPQQTTSNADTTSSLPLPKAAFVAVVSVASASFIATILCSGVILTAAIQRTVGRRKYRRRRRQRSHHPRPEAARNLRSSQPRRLHFAMRNNEAYHMTPYHSASATDLGPLQNDHATPYYEDVSSFD